MNKIITILSINFMLLSCVSTKNLSKGEKIAFAFDEIKKGNFINSDITSLPEKSIMGLISYQMSLIKKLDILDPESNKKLIDLHKNLNIILSTLSPELKLSFIVGGGYDTLEKYNTIINLAQPVIELLRDTEREIDSETVPHIQAALKNKTIRESITNNPESLIRFYNKVSDYNILAESDIILPFEIYEKYDKHVQNSLYKKFSFIETGIFAENQKKETAQLAESNSEKQFSLIIDELFDEGITLSKTKEEETREITRLMYIKESIAQNGFHTGVTNLVDFLSKPIEERKLIKGKQKMFLDSTIQLQKLAIKLDNLAIIFLNRRSEKWKDMGRYFGNISTTVKDLENEDFITMDDEKRKLFNILHGIITDEKIKSFLSVVAQFGFQFDLDKKNDKKAFFSHMKRTLDSHIKPLLKPEVKPPRKLKFYEL